MCLTEISSSDCIAVSPPKTSINDSCLRIPLLLSLVPASHLLVMLPQQFAPTIENKRVMDWLVEAFSVVPGARFHFVGGYKIDEVIASYPALGYTVNKEWRDTGSVSSLALAVSEEVEDLYVCYSDTVFRRHAVGFALSGKCGCCIWRRLSLERALFTACT